MKIAYILGSCISGKSNGVRSQANTWTEGLLALGHKVEQICPWGHYNWKEFDIIHVFGYGTWLDIVPGIAKKTNSKIVISPIIDATRSHFMHKLASYCGIPFLNMYSPVCSLRSVNKYISKYYVRSNYEMEYLTKSFDIACKDVELIPLTCRFEQCELSADRDNFCLHVSILSGPHKNVKRLILAAIKYNFRLVLAGSWGNDTFYQEMLRIVGNHTNIEILGFVSDDKLKDLYNRAKVFALPSIYEGVGLVALEAAAYGCDVVITKQGGPKEYYSGLSYLVNPYDIDEIGTTISIVLNGKTFQPQLKKHINENYNFHKLSKMLEKSYYSVIS